MNKILLIILIFVSYVSVASASDNQLYNSLQEDLPLPGGGIQLKPMKKITSSTTAEKILIAQKNIKEKGVYEVYNPDAMVIMNMSHLKPLKPGSNDPQDTNLKSTIEDVGLAFKFNGLPIDSKNVVGYGAGGTYKKGWTAVTVIFTDSELGVCQYELFNIKLSHGSEFIPEEIARYDVNGKVTIVDVRGNHSSGYLYIVHWADNNAMNDLRCASMSFEKEKTNKVINLAKEIDRSCESNVSAT